MSPDPQPARAFLTRLALGTLLGALCFACCLGLVRIAEADPCVTDSIDGPRPCQPNPGSN